MECDSVLGGGGGGLEFQLDPDIVSEEAGRLYAELQCVIEAHGSSSVEPLLPSLVSLLEALAQTRGQLREREREAEREREEREALLQRYEKERNRRRETEEKYLELDDTFEQERRMMRGRERERERRERELEDKAREQADTLLSVEEQKASLSRELGALRHTHNKLLRSYKEVMEKASSPDRTEHPPFPARGHFHLSRSEVTSDQGYPESPLLSLSQAEPSQDSLPDPASLEPQVAGASSVIGRMEGPSLLEGSSLLGDIIDSTPELAQFYDTEVDSRSLRLL